MSPVITEDLVSDKHVEGMFSTLPENGYAEIFVRIELKIGNGGDILRSCGNIGLRRIAQAIRSVIAQLADGAVAIEVSDRGYLSLRLPQVRFPDDVPLAVACEEWIRLVCRSVPLIPIWTEWGVLHVWLSGRWSIESADGGRVDGSDWLFEFPGDSVVDSEQSAERYRRDMAAASKVLGALGAADGAGPMVETLRIVWRPVVANGSDGVLYYQSVARFDEGRGEPRLPWNELAAVERIGFGDLIDENVVNAVVTELEADPSVVLSARISSLGAISGWWWGRVVARLEGRPELAARLVLEISEAAALAKGAEVGHFCAEARRLGCRIAIGDFGAGFASVRQLVTIVPDIVKIDGGFVRRASASSRDRAILAGLAQLAAAVAPVVVAEGADTLAHARLAAEVGLGWQQGHFWGSPSICRPWRGVRASAVGGQTVAESRPLAG
jgi:EAL domain-containing protein (putative c-di-GMP-specific phosphodiesterase class I)